MIGGKITYGYDENGDLAWVQNREDEVARYVYDTAYEFDGDGNVISESPLGRPHFLTRVINAGTEPQPEQPDPTDDVAVLTAEFYSTDPDHPDLDPSVGGDPDLAGRLKGLRDASGATAKFGYSMSLKRGRFGESVTDALGNLTEVIRDGRGNVVSQIQQVNRDGEPEAFLVTGYVFDPDDNLVATTRPQTFSTLALAEEFDPTTAPAASTSTYDDTNHPSLPTVMTDALGNETTYTYDAWGNPKTIVDPLHNSTVNTYDPDTGLLRKTTDAADGETSYSYDLGRLTSLAQKRDDGSFVIVGNYRYTSDGKLESTQDLAQKEAQDASNLINDPDLPDHHFAYDAEGRQTHSFHYEREQDVTLVSATAYDAEGRAESTASYELEGDRVPAMQADPAAALAGEVPVSTSSTDYDDAGRVATQTDAFGNVTTNRYDRRGQRIQSIAPDGTITYSVYDRNGRQVLSVDRHHPSQLVNGFELRGTRSLYDAGGRAVATERLRHVEVAVAADPNDPDLWYVQSVTGAGLTASGTTPATRQFDVDHDHFVTDASNLLSRSETHYNDDGRVDYTVSFANDPELRSETHYTYDAAGRQTSVKQVLVPGFAPDGSDDTRDLTSYSFYDAAGRLTHSVAPELWYHDPAADAWVFAYDPLDVSDPDQFPAERVTEYRYDAVGRQEHVILPQAWHWDGTQLVSARAVTDTLYDLRGRRVGEADANGITTNYAYDDSGRLTGVTLPEVWDAGDEAWARPAYVYTYDSYGNQLTQQDAEGRVTSFDYDLSTSAENGPTCERQELTHPRGRFDSWASPTREEALVAADGAMDGRSTTFQAPPGAAATGEALRVAGKAAEVTLGCSLFRKAMPVRAFHPR